MEELIGLKEAARVLDVERTTLIRWHKSGRVPVAFRVDNKPLFRKRDIEKLAALGMRLRKRAAEATVAA